MVKSAGKAKNRKKKNKIFHISSLTTAKSIIAYAIRISWQKRRRTNTQSPFRCLAGIKSAAALINLFPCI
jgi:hypothetical protein